MAVVLAAAWVATGCSAPSEPAREGAEAVPSDGQRVWRSDGYGRHYVLKGNRLRAYETTAISCIRSDSYARIGSPDAAGVQDYGSDGETEVTLRPGRDGAVVYRESGTVSEIDLLPVPALPATCGKKPGQDPLTTFDVFWTTMDENYNSLDRRKVDWNALRDRYRPMVDEDTGDERLFEIMKSMLEPLGDMHTGLSDSDDRYFEGERPGTPDVDSDDSDAAADAFLRSAGATNRVSFGAGRLVYADLPNGRGYLRIGAFSGLSDDDGASTDAAEVDRMLDAVLTPARVAVLRMLVIDLRNNPGGYDALGIKIAGRLTDRSYTAYTKSARNDPGDPSRHARDQPVTVAPAAGPRYSGPIRMLTGPLTISAAETFTVAMMGRSPVPERFGEHTQGVFSDTMYRELPNGWSVILGNEDFVGPDGRNHEGPGIPPTTAMPVFPPAELAGKQDSVLAAALR